MALFARNGDGHVKGTKTQELIRDREMLCREIMRAALRHCHDLGFTVKAGWHRSLMIELSDKTLDYYDANKH